jgi:hypothetical protein
MAHHHQIPQPWVVPLNNPTATHQQAQVPLIISPSVKQPLHGISIAERYDIVNHHHYNFKCECFILLTNSLTNVPVVIYRSEYQQPVDFETANFRPTDDNYVNNYMRSTSITYQQTIPYTRFENQPIASTS